ncbi:hypothetical protein A6U97_13415 [Agrobacterium tumefaciens]|uniref:DUF6680 family protein n=1 Tax=Agrobacterium tumefaciens TaxID=358 RepID=UPI00081016B6|nr:hypothetical protein A6U97_13415 [Agrobacterium tumefaciens]
MIEWIAENPATIAAFLSALAALLSVVATWQGPRSAAKLSEQIRTDTERESERRRMKLQVFSTLMQERATIASLDSVRMLNSIDFVFSESPRVREAWADLFAIFHTADTPHPQLREEKLRVLLKEMGADIGLSETLKVDDIARIYYPNALAQEEELQMLRRQQALLQIRSQGQQQVASQGIDERLVAKFPPKPS